jgi:hypothetical protein
MSTKPILFLAFAAACLLSSCATVNIARINADPTRFQSRTVRVSGTVVNAVGALGTGGYQVEDRTGRIYVLSAGTGVPARGSFVTVTGRVQAGIVLLGRPFGTAIREEHHKVR